MNNLSPSLKKSLKIVLYNAASAGIASAMALVTSYDASGNPEVFLVTMSIANVLLGIAKEAVEKWGKS